MNANQFKEIVQTDLPRVDGKILYYLYRLKADGTEIMLFSKPFELLELAREVGAKEIRKLSTIRYIKRRNKCKPVINIRDQHGRLLESLKEEED